MAQVTDSAYASAGVDAGGAGRGVAALVGVLRTIDTGREQRSLLGSGHYASVLRLAGSSGLVLSTDGVGTKLIVPELIRGHPSPTGIDLVGMCVGLVDLDDVISGDRVKPGDAIIGLPSSGVHSNGYTLARRALPALDEAPAELAGATVGETLLEPTVIYVRAVRALLASGLDVRGLAHITGDGLLNLTRLHAKVGYRIDSPLPVPPVFELIGARAGVDPAEMWQVFNMGCGFCCVVPSESADQAVALLAERHPGAGVIGEATDRAGHVELPFAGLAGRAGEGFAAV